MIIGVGIDLCDVRRMQRQLEADDGFAATVFLPDEIAYCSPKHHPAQHYAARYAAKEAVVKALATAGGEGTFWLDIEIVRRPDGQPCAALRGRLRDLADDLGVAGIHLSLTHTDDTAAAVAIVEGVDRGAP
jgi:holo-[acyl-carrier protein] synthase